jgi:putative peptide zinc metalloprotease protein
MSLQADHSVREISSARLKLRGDLIVTPQLSAGQPYYMVEDPLNSRFFRLGPAEYVFVSLLDGQTTIHDGLAHLSTVMPGHCMTEIDAAAHCRWLVEMDLAHTVESSQHARLADSAETVHRRKALANSNPLVFRLPLGSPDRALATLAKSIGWLYSAAAGVVWLVLLILGAYLVAGDWDRFMASSQGMFAPSNWLWLALCWLGLKIVHEMSHGVVCHLHGGNVRETGILFILLAPLAYVDVTSSWRFRSRLARMHVAAAGMYMELLISALAAILWSQTDSGWLNHLCFNVIAMASLSTLLFNANPLMKFDGYYILSDALAMPNLYTNGQSYWNYWSRRYLLGLPAGLPDWSRGKRALLAAYGLASLIWRMLICVSMILTAATLFQGAGVVLASLAVALWIGLPVYRLLHFLIAGEQVDNSHRLRLLITAGPAMATAIFVLGFVPWPGASEAPVVVDYAPSVVIRAASPGFVREIHVEGGELVRQGQLLLRLENRELSRELADLKLQIRQSELRGRQHEQKGELAAQQSEAEKRSGLSKQLAEIQSQADKLTVHAPCAGRVIRRNLDTLRGTYLEEGREILTLGSESQKELLVSLAQEDLEVFTQRVGKPVRVNVPGHAPWLSSLQKVIPRATLIPPHEALATANGGSLPVKPIAERDQASESDRFELLAPRFTAIVRLSETDSRALRTGQCASVSYRPFDESIGEHLLHGFAHWIRQRLAP